MQLTLTAALAQHSQHLTGSCCQPPLQQLGGRHSGYSVTQYCASKERKKHAIASHNKLMVSYLAASSRAGSGSHQQLAYRASVKGS